MRYLIISDTHGNKKMLKKVLEKNNDVDGVFFLGDGLSDFRTVMQGYLSKVEYVVNGNCDGMGNGLPKTIELLGYKILYVHGDIYAVKQGLEKLCNAAKTRGCEIALFGHTHKPLCATLNGIYLFNPGTLGMANEKSHTYGIMELNEGKEPCFLHVSAENINNK